MRKETTDLREAAGNEGGGPGSNRTPAGNKGGGPGSNRAPAKSARRAKTDTPSSKRTPIVSSAHLVSDRAAGLSEVEYGLIVAGNAFGLWTVRGTAAARAEFPDVAELGVIDILCLHSVNHRGRAKRLADICFKLNVEDTHVVNYALKKLVRAGLVASSKSGKEVHYSTTEKGIALIAKYSEIREACLIDAVSALGEVDARSLSDLARQLRVLSGLYGQAARSATNM